MYADICELGFPHNTPIADGGQIQTRHIVQKMV